ncbi:hypothetical protein P3T73_15225 [Kiritimatiellota bacterium B12222]|nr:hypothetical protein P3T73_15225 [Kiritimatiellota bacterium B12222]
MFNQTSERMPDAGYVQKNKRKRNALGVGTYRYLLRFNASVDDCILYAESIVSRNDHVMAGGWTRTPYSALNSDEWDPFGERYPWWDRNQIETGIKWEYHYRDTLSGPSIYEVVYVDTVRGILYYFSGD